MTDLAAAYELVPYPTRAQSSVHPDRLAALACLHGLEPHPLETCRVLEIGCGDGGNLIPIAAALPDCRCEGIDGSAAAVQRGSERAARAGVGNVSFRCAPVETPGVVDGEFDYILCHGVYSWVPAEVREAILGLCHRHLAPHGLALVSYNAMPGGCVRQATRQMLRWHVRDLTGASERLEEARALAQFLEERMVEQDEHARALQAELHLARAKVSGHFFHDDLAPVNDPFYLHEFMAHAGRHHLRYVADADLTDLARPALPEDLRSLIHALSDDRIEREQYLDFLVARRFRQTILCRADRAVADAPVAERLGRCWFAAPVSDTTPANVRAAGTVAVFEKAGGPRLETDFLSGKVAMAALAGAWPRRLSFAELERLARAAAADVPRAPGWTEATRQGLCRFLLEAMAARLVVAHAFMPRLATAAGEYPRAFPPARLLAAEGDLVVSALHLLLRLEPPAARALLSELDGTRSRADLLERMVAGRASAPCDQQDGWPVTREALDTALSSLGARGLLVA